MSTCLVCHNCRAACIRICGRLSVQQFVRMVHNTNCAGRIIQVEHANRELDIPPRHKWRGLPIGFPRFIEDVYSIPAAEGRRAKADERGAHVAKGVAAP